MKTQTSNMTVAVLGQTSPASLKGSPLRSAFVRAALLLTIMVGLSSCEVPGIGYGGGYGSSYGRNYSGGISRYANAYSSYPRSTGYSYGGYPRSSGYSTPRNFGGSSSRHSSSYGVQHSYGRSFARPSYGGGGHGGGFNGGGRGRH
ncbi:MAG: hypothetical protein WAW39_29565 [Prosthecobacter sp.]|uniref:hypothetical protein n=1 Tax=Prosthecobacter sp. TaxID=1965333 RepID=UPI003BAE8936